MTKEPIIIDDVDVSECEHRRDNHKELLADGHIKEFKNYCQINNDGCYAINYHYKLYKRKEQECEELKKKLNPKLKNAHCTYFEGQTGLCKAKEFSRCNPVNCKLYTIDELSTIVDLQQQLDQLKTKYKELKTCYNNNLEVLRHEEKVNNNLTDRCMKAEQALQQIREVIKQEGYINKKTKIFKGSVLYQAMEDLKLPDRKILKIINEVLDD